MRDLFIKFYYSRSKADRDYIKELYFGPTEYEIADGTLFESIPESFMFKFYEFVEYVQEQLEN